MVLWLLVGAIFAALVLTLLFGSLGIALWRISRLRIEIDDLKIGMHKYTGLDLRVERLERAMRQFTTAITQEPPR